MRNARIIVIVLLALGYLVLPLNGQVRSASAREHTLSKSKIVGTVLDRNEARVAGATIKLESERFRRVLLSDDQGSFEVEL
ncbi:MAG TPA: hypothetical protein VF766_10410, partial [Pyrinomonadaceae bacterium]